jgi:membrane fusion protein (multidrug efflux system)
VIVTADNSPTDPVPLDIRAFVAVHAPRQAPVTVPRLAVFNSTSDPAVYVVVNGRVKRVPVSIGAQDDSRAEIRSGLTAGQLVALTGTQTLSDGEKVRVARVQQ